MFSQIGIKKKKLKIKLKNRQKKNVLKILCSQKQVKKNITDLSKRLEKN